MKKYLMAISLLAAILTQSCNSTDKSATMATDDSTAHSATDTTLADTSKTAKSTENGAEGAMFIEQAAIGGMLEVEMAQLGQQKSTQKDIKDFSAMIVKDHTAANAELKTLAQKKGLQLPTALPAMKQEHIKDLNTMTGKDFNSYYTNMMVEDHITDIALFEGASKSPDTAISKFAAKILPILKNHYKQARDLSAQFDQNKPKNP